MYNRVTLVGRLSRKPELKTGNSGNQYTKFSIAVNSYNSGKEDTQWFDIAAFGKTAELCNAYLDKGSQILVEGSLQNNVYEKEGVKHKSISIIANRVIFLSPKQSNGQQPQVESTPVPTQAEGEVFGDGMVDDIPF